MVVKNLSLVIVVLFVLTISVNPVQAQCATLTTVDNSISLRWTNIQNYQSSYLIANNRYYQALWSHTTTPSALTLANNLTSHPSYQAETAQALFTAANISTTLPMRIRIDWYDGPSGKGYVLTIEVVACGVTKMRSINVGPEPYRDRAWTEVVTTP